MEIIKIVIGFLGALFLGYSVSLIEKAIEINRLRKNFLGIPLSRIAGLKDSLVRIKGVVKPYIAPLKAPFSGRDCVYHRFRIMMRKLTFRKSGLRGNSAEIDFVLEDDSGSVRISPTGGRFIVRNVTIGGKDLSPTALSNLKKLITLKGGENLEDYRIIEEHLEPGEEVTVMGEFRHGENALKSTKKLPLLVIRCSDEAFVVIYNRALFRLIFTAMCFLATGIFDFYLLFLFK